MRNFALTLNTALLVCAAFFAPQVHADDSIKMIVPFSVGGPTDQIARIIGPRLGAELGKTVIVENRGGAGGIIGAGQAAKSPADGKTLLLTTSSLVITTGTTPNLSYDARKDFEPVYLLGKVQTMLAVRPSLGVNTLAELVEKAKSSKDSLNYGSTGVGGTMHIGAELLSQAANIPLMHIPYGGAAPALVGLIGGSVDLVNADVPVLRPFIQDGRLKGLVIYDTQRSRQLPDIPTAAEAGLPQLLMTNWYGILVPAGTPLEERNKLEAALDKVVHQPDIARKLENAGFSDPQGSVGFKARLDEDFKRWLPWLKAANIRTQ